MADPEQVEIPVEEPARRRFTIFGLEVTGCGCLLMLVPFILAFVIWFLAIMFGKQ